MAEVCTNIQKSIAWCQGKAVYPGIRRRVYYISVADIVKWPKLPVDETSGKITSTVYEGDFELAAEKKWLYIDVDTRKSRLTSDPQGELPSQTQLNKLVLVHSDVSPEASAAALYLNNDDCVFLAQDMEGRYRVVGSDRWQGVCTVTQDGGEGQSGTAGTTINVEVSDVCPAPYYNGLIDAEDAKFMADGSEVPGVGG